MPRLKSSNFAISQLVGDINDTATSLEVADASLFPDEGPFMILISNVNTGVREIIEVTSINKATKTMSGLLRGREGTTAVAHTTGERVEGVWTAGAHQELADKAFHFTGVLANTDWTGTSAPYTKTVTVTGISSTGKPPVIDITLSSTWDTALIEEEEWGKIKRIECLDNSLKFYAESIPTVSLNFKGIQVK